MNTNKLGLIRAAVMGAIFPVTVFAIMDARDGSYPNPWEAFFEAVKDDGASVAAIAGSGAVIGIIGAMVS